jgi:hypothetical protein
MNYFYISKKNPCFILRDYLVIEMHLSGIKHIIIVLQFHNIAILWRYRCVKNESHFVRFSIDNDDQPSLNVSPVKNTFSNIFIGEKKNDTT